MNVTDLLILMFIIPWLFTAYEFPSTREKVEQTCVKEPKWKTFLDQFIFNFLISAPIVLVVWLIDKLTGVFS